MAEPLSDQILRKIGEARELYHRLILMVGSAGSGKTEALQELVSDLGLIASLITCDYNVGESPSV